MTTMTLDDFTARLRTAFGDGLAAVVLYGSQAAPGATLHGSDYNVLVLATRLGPADLAAAAPAVRAWREAGHPPPMTMSVDEWRRSVDVFPIEVADILARHRVLAGALPEPDHPVRPADLRHQLEFEARGKLLQLRAGAMATAGNPDEQTALLARSVSAFVTMTRAALRLAGEQPPAAAADVVQAAARVAGFPAAPVIAALAAKRGEKPADPGAAFAAYVDAAEQLARWLDQWTAP
ncbi:MAG: hypothetical protein ACK53A_00880 [Gemmatimonadota bacterium]|jgi:hypothetical protein|nr:hypothetical protein [Gemmatimonadota bacterium]